MTETKKTETEPSEARSPKRSRFANRSERRFHAKICARRIRNPSSAFRWKRLDDLMKIVRDLTISRSVFEQRLGELDYQIEELQRSTRRLQRSTNRLETEFEVDMLENKNFKFQVSDFRFQNQESMLESAPEFDALEFDRYTEFHQTTRELGERRATLRRSAARSTACAAISKRFSTRSAV
jgi:hypothetical protein